MQGSGLMDAQMGLVRRMTSIVTRLVPDGSGVHLRFINKPNDDGLNNLNKASIEEHMDFTPKGSTMIGTNLEEKILKRFIYNVIDQDELLQRPYLILIITDGKPSTADGDKLKSAIAECGRRLTERGYPQKGMRASCPQPYWILWPDAYKYYKAVMFLISQIGQSNKAEAFLDKLEGVAEIEPVLFRTAGRSILKP